MSNLNQIQKTYLKTITNIEDYIELKKLFKKTNREIAGLTEEQIYCIDNTVCTDIARKKLIKIFRKDNLVFDIKESLN